MRGYNFSQNLLNGELAGIRRDVAGGFHSQFGPTTVDSLIYLRFDVRGRIERYRVKFRYVGF